MMKSGASFALLTKLGIPNTVKFIPHAPADVLSA
jgi:hypothetical protein